MTAMVICIKCKGPLDCEPAEAPYVPGATIHICPPCVRVFQGDLMKIVRKQRPEDTGMPALTWAVMG